ncbi:MAG: SPFH domain-containing protein [Campylobacterota bacterium]|nr:SPFH domain-containing protein [Campylobacterota bacterium]
MGLFDWLTGQFIDVIEWTDDTQDTMVYRFNRHGNEIKYGAKLIVRESQMAVFVNEGQIADILGPGTYELETKNLPILTSLQHWDHGFNSPFKAEIYFVNTKRFIDLKWGTKNSIMLRDPEFDMVRLRAFGTYEIRVQDPKKFITEIVGTDGHFSTDEIDAQLTNLIVSKFASIMGENEIAALDLAANYETLGEFMATKISPYFEEYGLSLTKMLVENISLPEEVEKILDRRTGREITDNLDENLKYQTGEALGNKNAGGAADMVGMGAGLAMANQMAGSLQGNKGVPPMIPDSHEHYFIAIDKKAHGPYDTDTIEMLIHDGTIIGDSLVWTEGMDKWQKASTVLSRLFKTTPPAL